MVCFPASASFTISSRPDITILMNLLVIQIVLPYFHLSKILLPATLCSFASILKYGHVDCRCCAIQFEVNYWEKTLSFHGVITKFPLLADSCECQVKPIFLSCNDRLSWATKHQSWRISGDIRVQGIFINGDCVLTRGSDFLCQCWYW